MKFTTPTFLSGIFLLISVNLFSQTTITGTVIDGKEKHPLSYASIRLKEKAVGTVANKDGSFTLSINASPESLTLVVSFIGYKSYEIPLTEFIPNTSKIIELQPDATQLDELIVSDEKFDLQEFMKQVVRAYQSSARAPHIAHAYYEEQTSLNGKPVMLADGVGYSIYLGDAGEWAPLSNYKFFYEQVSVNEDVKSWTDHMNKSNAKPQTFGGGVSLNNFRCFELEGPFGDNANKFTYKLDSAFSLNGQAYLTISYQNHGQEGWLLVGEDNLQVKLISYEGPCAWSTAYNQRVKGVLAFAIDYFEDKPYLSSAASYYRKGNITNWNQLKVVSQKFDKLELSSEEYWAINTLNYFVIEHAKEIETNFQRYEFMHKGPNIGKEFNGGFKGQAIDTERNPEYAPLLAKLRAFF